MRRVLKLPTLLLFAAMVMLATSASATSGHLAVEPAFNAPAPEQLVHNCMHDHPHHQAAIKRDLEASAHILQTRTHEQERAFAAQAPQPIRIVLSAVDLTTSSKYCTAVGQTRSDFQGGNVVCTADNVLTTAKRNLLVNTILPQALSRLTSRIRVNRFTSNLITAKTCSSHTIPASHSTTGVANADYVLYVAAGPVSGSTVAWAGSCQTDSTTGRPITGRANFDPEHLSYTTAAELEQLVDTATHELLHALGLSGGFYADKGRSSKVTKRGKSVTELDSTMSTLLAEARRFTGCSTLTGVELEDEGSTFSAGSHFERRLYKDEIMTAAGGSKLSKFSLLALQDLGVGYTIDTTSAEEMDYGKSTGCGFHTSKCNTVAGGSGSYFCFDQTGTSDCTYDRKGSGRCSLATYSADLPSYFQYFSGQPRVGGGGPFMDACPSREPFTNRVCNDATFVGTSNDDFWGHTFATESRCIKTTSNFLVSPKSGTNGEPRCLRVRCPGGTRVQLAVGKTGAWTDCPLNGAAGSIALAGYGGTATCPTAVEICADKTLHYTVPAAKAAVHGAHGAVDVAVARHENRHDAAAGGASSNEGASTGAVSGFAALAVGATVAVLATGLIVGAVVMAKRRRDQRQSPLVTEGDLLDGAAVAAEGGL